MDQVFNEKQVLWLKDHAMAHYRMNSATFYLSLHHAHQQTLQADQLQNTLERIMDALDPF